MEVGSRCHGGEGTWKSIVEECLGYDQVRPRGCELLSPHRASAHVVDAVGVRTGEAGRVSFREERIESSPLD